MNNNFLIIYLLLFAVTSIIFTIIVIRYVKKDVPELEQMAYDDILAIIQHTIDQEFSFRYKLDYELKDIRMLPSFETELDYIVKAVLLSFSDDFYRQIEFYHKREYVYGVVTKRVEILLIEFTDKIKIKTK